MKFWTQTEPRLKTFASEFEAEWITIQKPILTMMSDIAKLSWKQKCVNVHFVDCIHGASGWIRDVVLPPFPNIDVEKKLLAYELAHTIIDLIAYFSVKEHVAEPEKQGIKPNPNYYTNVEKLYPVFKKCYMQPENFPDFETILRRIRLQVG
jgi:hypothetical protein